MPQDVGDILMGENRRILQEKNENDLRRDARKLEIRNDDIDRRNKRLKDDINSHRLKPLKSYQLGWEKPNRRAVPGQTNDTIMQAFYEILKMKCLAFSTGVSITKATETDMTFGLHPYIYGESQGSYRVSVTRQDADTIAWKLKNHDLPATVPVNQLANELNRSSQDETGRLRTFVESLFRYLRAFASRRCQIERLQHDFESQPDILHLITTPDFCQLKLKLSITDGDGTFDIRIVLEYDLDSERPKEDSLRVKVNGRTLEEEDTKALIEQCEVLYEKPLPEAVKAAFQE